MCIMYKVAAAVAFGQNGLKLHITVQHIRGSVHYCCQLIIEALLQCHVSVHFK